jgi:phage replication-related protein YjqB (UPF0714/DUF867 family)
MTVYRSIRELAAAEPPGKAFCIEWRRGRSGLVVMAIHGGGIEPGTTEIAAAAAGRKHGFYSFTGTKPVGNRTLHISSRLFDEPIGIHAATSAETVATVHGCKGRETTVYLGGRDEFLKKTVKAALQEAGFTVAESGRFPGISVQNICNRGRSGRGLQLELSRGLRGSFFVDPAMHDRSRRRASFYRFVDALQAAFASLAAR